MQMATLLLFIPAIFFADEHTRLLAYGIIVAGVFAFAIAVGPQKASITLVVIGVLLLRWIPFSEVILWRELVVLIGAIAVLLCAGRLQSAGRLTPAPAVMALTIALVTPIFPGRMLLFPFAVAGLMLVPLRFAIGAGLIVAACHARYSIAVLCVAAAIALMLAGRKSLAPLYPVAIALFALWPWSGIVARAFPALLFAEPAAPQSQPVWMTIERSQSVSLDAPPGARAVVITASAANASRLPVGRAVGWVEAGGTRTMLRIGDIADFGFMRREHFFASRNRPPMTPLDDIHDYGSSAWLHTAGRVRLSSAGPLGSLRVAAAPDLPPGAKLQIEAVEFE